jgi:hypothetical protein
MAMKYMKRLFWRLVVSAVVLYLLSLRFADVSAGIPLGQHPLEAGWDRTGLPVSEVTLEGWNRVSTAFESMAALEARMDRLVRELRLKPAAPPARGENAAFRYLNTEGTLPDGSRGLVSLQTIAIGDETETHLGFILMRPGQFHDLAQAVQDYERILCQAGLRGRLSITITGAYPGRLADQEIRRIFSRSFHALAARRVAGENIGEYSSWLGKSKMLPGKAEINGAGINLEASAVYDRQRNTTVVTLATPAENV